MAHEAASLRNVSLFLRGEYERAFRHDHWHIGIVDAPIWAFLEPDPRLDVRWWPLPERGHYYADPFGLARGGTTHVLLEEFDFRSNKGAISWAAEESDGRFTSPRVVLDLPFHASYPYLIERAGNVFCIPETAGGREVALYQAVHFPRVWTKAATLIPGVAAADSTVFEHDGRFWLFCTDEDDGPYSKLRIWYASDLLGPWTPHPANPVKTDITSARPAGTPFRWDGDVYRPAQDSSATYGGSITLNRIVALTTSEYAEERAAAVGPFRAGVHTHGIHTLAAVGERTLVDGKRFAFNRQEMVRNVRESLRSGWGRTLLGR